MWIAEPRDKGTKLGKQSIGLATVVCLFKEINRNPFTRKSESDGKREMKWAIRFLAFFYQLMFSPFLLKETGWICPYLLTYSLIGLEGGRWS